MLTIDTQMDLTNHVGEEIGCSDWVTIDQKMIDDFAALTGDRNWYHVDRERASRELPGGKPIAHGLLTLSLVPGLAAQIVQVRHRSLAFNYGSDKVRYPKPVPAGSRIRLRMKIVSAEPADKGTLLVRRYTMELEGSTKPAMVADMLSLIVAPTAPAAG
ncbi:MaoC family dehydratase [Hydrogenophaga laconesensis]|uniref:Acyl dehydratase n=1 Tax=Hydrogenophaga laconesensis TaxID=1805971 RepID=A0ABU1VIZ5_9BURK|nr:MaoC family dehydratase [Hydrogenophaga laconesensis]MDR7097457.1 acyl dehydratase [Hydrogenophaga laconesensis]